MRLLVTETLDPDGAMHHWCTPDLVALGHEALPLPTQELAPLLGPDGLAAWIVAVAEAARPDAVLLCPPYDHVSRATLEQLTALGAQPVAFCFDEPLFRVNGARAEALAGYRHRFVTAPDRVASLPQPAHWIRWAASPSAFSERAELPETWRMIEDAVVLVGRPYARRIELVTGLAARGVPVVVFGHGWGEPNLGPFSRTPQVGPPLTGPEMHTVLARAGLVLTTGDWEGQALPMVKYRLLEAAFCGGPQLVQLSPDLAAYFSEDEVASYASLDELAERAQALLADRTTARAMAERAQARAYREHTWQVRFGELSFAGSVSPGSRQSGDMAPAAYLVGLSLIAHDAERRGAQRLASAAFSLWDRLAPNPTAAAGLARISGDPVHSTRALALLEADPRPAAGLYARLPTHVGTGLGQVGYLDPSAELTAMRLAALLAEPDLVAAERMIEDLRADPDRLVATAALLVPDGPDESLPLWRAFFSAAWAATPDTRDFDEHRARWRAVSDG